MDLHINDALAHKSLLCRICASNSKDPLISIYCGGSNNFALKIMFYLPIKVIPNDGLPLKLCTSCLDNILKWDDFYQTCVDADKRLRSIFSNKAVLSGISTIAKKETSRKASQIDEYSSNCGKLIVEQIEQEDNKNTMFRTIGEAGGVYARSRIIRSRNHTNANIIAESFVIKEEVDINAMEDVIIGEEVSFDESDEIYLAHGAPRQILSWAFKMAVCTVGNIILETCDSLWDELSAIYLSQPNEDEWRRIADEFYTLSEMPNCVGAIDGKHVNIKCPPNAGSEYFNYKGHHSIILLAACDINLCFTAIDIGAYGSQSDGGVFSNSVFGKQILNETLPLPKDKNLPDSNIMFPHYFVADSAFPLKRNLMRPFPGRGLRADEEYFNTRLSKARRLIENSFGVLTSRWRILFTTINCYPDNADKIVKGVVLLHNFCKMNDNAYCPTNYIDHLENGIIVEGLWRQENQQLRPFKQNTGLNASRNAFRFRDVLKNCFVM